MQNASKCQVLFFRTGSGRSTALSPRIYCNRRVRNVVVKAPSVQHLMGPNAPPSVRCVRVSTCSISTHIRDVHDSPARDNLSTVLGYVHQSPTSRILGHSVHKSFPLVGDNRKSNGRGRRSPVSSPTVPHDVQQSKPYLSTGPFPRDVHLPVNHYSPTMTFTGQPITPPPATTRRSPVRSQPFHS